MTDWRRILGICVVAVGVAPAVAGPLELSDDNVCAWVLQQVTGSELEAEVAVVRTFEEFKDAKAEVAPLRVKQYRSPEQGMAQSVACKLSSVEGLREKAGVAGNLLGEQRSCKYAHQRMLEVEYQRLAPGRRQLMPADFTLLEDETTWMGPLWLYPNPYPALVRGDSGGWQLQGKVLEVSNAWYVPLPASVKGVHYCTVVAPEYLRKVLSGD
ncbi:hypothetical protein [Haliea sp. E17]|uniref:hypothetical protein n=1 Tax=Haliea sp. E17 TaxID=3401576 RepID=UPI003AAC11B5